MIVENDGVARIKGLRVRVADIVRKYYILRYSKREIADQYNLTLEEVNEALEYYIDHKREINRIIREEQDLTLELIKLRKKEIPRKMRFKMKFWCYDLE